jgi:hypothetical protein
MQSKARGHCGPRRDGHIARLGDHGDRRARPKRTVSNERDGTVRLDCQVRVVAQREPDRTPFEVFPRAIIADKRDEKLQTVDCSRLATPPIPFGRAVFQIIVS